MIDEIELHGEEVRALCRRFDVRRLDLFRFAARGGRQEVYGLRSGYRPSLPLMLDKRAG